ncbi:MAG: hypothetical protein ACQEWG_16390 [Bacteroidota bacterium]
MSKIVIKRKSQWANKMRGIGLYLNGEKIGTIDDGETKEFQIEPGLHRLSAKIDWCGSPIEEIKLKQNDVKHVELSGFKKSQWLLPSLLFFAGISLVLSFFDIDTSFITWTILLPLLLYLFYFVTIGRKKYLSLNLK